VPLTERIGDGRARAAGLAAMTFRPETAVEPNGEGSLPRQRGGEQLFCMRRRFFGVRAIRRRLRYTIREFRLMRLNGRLMNTTPPRTFDIQERLRTLRCRRAHIDTAIRALEQYVALREPGTGVCGSDPNQRVKTHPRQGEPS
jgi:hypothetical protein